MWVLRKEDFKESFKEGLQNHSCGTCRRREDLLEGLGKILPERLLEKLSEALRGT